jgi:hypothetical protein
MDLLELPFHFLRIPNLRLKLPKVSQPGPMTVFSLVFLSYFLVISGVIYDVIVEPPSIGSTQDEATGAVKPVAFLQYRFDLRLKMVNLVFRVNGQYIIEGLSAGLLFSVGGVGFIVLDRANQKFTSNRNRYLLLLSGALFVLVAYNLSLVFLRMKIPGQL